MDDYTERFGEGYEFEYSIRKRYGRVELEVRLYGDPFNPFEDGSGAKERSFEKVLYRQLRDKTATIYYNYVNGYNIITVYSSGIRHRELAVKSPILWALILGLAAGLICRHLPDGISRFLTQDLADPVFSVTIGMMTGIMGPASFISPMILTAPGSISRYFSISSGPANESREELICFESSFVLNFLSPGIMRR